MSTELKLLSASQLSKMKRNSPNGKGLSWLIYICELSFSSNLRAVGGNEKLFQVLPSSV